MTVVFISYVLLILKKLSNTRVVSPLLFISSFIKEGLKSDCLSRSLLLLPSNKTAFLCSSTLASVSECD